MYVPLHVLRWSQRSLIMLTSAFVYISYLLVITHNPNPSPRWISLRCSRPRTQESHSSCGNTLHIMVVAVDKPHIPLRYGTCVRNGRRLALAVVTFLLPLEFPSCINIFQTGHHRAGYIFQDRLTTRRSAGSNDIAISQGNSRARTGLSASTARSLDTRRPSRQSGEHHRPCRTSAENVVEEDGIPVLSDDDLRGLPIRQEIDPGRLTAIEEERHAGPPSSPGPALLKRRCCHTRSMIRSVFWMNFRHLELVATLPCMFRMGSARTYDTFRIFMLLDNPNSHHSSWHCPTLV